MIKRLCVFLIIACTCFFHSRTVFAQYSEWKENGIRGKVKSITTYFIRDTIHEENSKLPDTSWYHYKAYRHFNESGMVDSFSMQLGHEGLGDGLSGYSTYGHYVFDKTGRKKFGKATNKAVIPGEMTPPIENVSKEFSTFTWTDSLNYNELAFDLDNMDKNYAMFYRLDKDYFLENIEHIAFGSEGDTIMHVITTQVKDESGRVKQSTETSSHDNKPMNRTFFYTSLDKFENPITGMIKLEGDEEGLRTILFYKKYEYYD